MMTIGEFAESQNFGLDRWGRRFLTRRHDNSPILLDDEAIEILGYKSDTQQQRPCAIRLLEREFSDDQNKTWWRYTNAGYTQFLEEQKINSQYPPAKTGRGSGKTIYTLVTPSVFEHLVLAAQTIRASRTRAFFIRIKDLLVLYWEYQCVQDQTFQDELEMLMKSDASNQLTRMAAITQLEREVRRNTRVGCVYFIKEVNTKNTKIGWAWSAPDRLKNLQCGNSSELILLATEFTQQPWKLEAHLHARYAEYHIRGEWYAIPNSEVLEF